MNSLVFFEIFANIVIVMLWFHFMGLTSFFIDELMPKYMRTESFSTTWLYFMLEIFISVIVFDVSIRILSFFHGKLFTENKTEIDPRLWSMLTIVFSIVVFQKSFQKRAQKIFAQGIGHRNKYDLYCC